MKRLLLLPPLLALSLFGASEARAQAPLPVTLPGLTDLEVGDAIALPVTLDAEVPEGTEILAFQGTVQYDSTVLRITGATNDETLTDGWLLSSNFGADSVRFASANATPIAPEDTPGTLFILEAELIAEGTSPLTFTDFLINEGEPAFTTTDGFVVVGEAGEQVNDLNINEVLYDVPDGEAGDANNDGERDTSNDQFIELTNAPDAEAFDLSGYALSDADDAVRHTFPEGTLLPAGEAVTVFGGGAPTNIPGLVQTASTGTLGLDDTGDAVTLNDPDGRKITSSSYSDGSAVAESLARDPDYTGSFARHRRIDRDDNGTPDDVPFSPGFLNAGTDPLPVELSGFTAVAEGRAAVLTWKTLSETAHQGFEVQQQVEGRFERVSFAPGAEGGTSSEARAYSYRVEGLPPGTHTFRLRQVDLDGRDTFSREVDVTTTLAAAYALASATPNPFRSCTTFRLDVKAPQQVRVTLYNVLGQRVRSLYDGPATPGHGRLFSIDAAGLPSGRYFYRVEGETFSEARSVTLLR